MDATPIDLVPARPGGDLRGSATSLTLGDAAANGAGAVAERWAALHDAAAVVATLAGLPGETPTARIRAFPAAVRVAGRSQRRLAEQGVEDICAMMEPGLAALLSVHSRGGDTAAPAVALWEEFRRARDAVLGLV